MALERALIGAAFLSPRKARLLAHVLVANGYADEELRQQFALRGR